MTAQQTADFVNYINTCMHDAITFLFSVLILAAIITGFVIMYIIMKNLFTIKDTLVDYFDIIADIKYEERYTKECLSKEERIKYSNDILIYTQKLIKEIAIMQFNNFKDGHNLEKVTKANIKEMIGVVAKEAKDSFGEEYPDFNKLLFNKQFFEKYIIDYTIYICKDLLEAEIEEID